ncbi:ABC transporter ATP-binding protein [Rhodopirellula sp. MGV]|uniref:ABC transporter ATP-binding protein n=1 Tax=Rhodopirellula sp. MGV TaxID=2023130 RepID=UPI000B9787D6|nr:ABC transporter ATP-binding protein [Rhodopirellula sp. MGV]OYP31169.1 multidrug ABC transporter ATP-binding protein [Rhodopirellula sp. MGV]PNY36008.1 ABC transporter ATP-binding protein [Rhodopirellula baltica]
MNKPSLSNDVVVQTHELTKRYDEFTALDSLSIQVGRGQILGFIGPNGAGKTTTIRILVGLSRPTSGSASIAGADCVTEARKIKRLVGYMPDDFGKYNNMRVGEYLDFFGAAYGIGRRKRMLRIDEVLEIAGATYMKDLFVDALSRGMQQRVAIARTLMHDPEVLILDEPANGLDPQARIDMRIMLLRLAEMGKTLIVTSHILPELARVCDVVAMITKGKLRAFGTVDEIMRDIKQRRTMEIQLVDSASVDTVTELTNAWLKNGNGESTAEPAHAEAIVRFSTSLTDAELAPLLGHLIERQQLISQFREVPTDLEDAFLSVAGKGEDAPLADSHPTPADNEAVEA